MPSGLYSTKQCMKYTTDGSVLYTAMPTGRYSTKQWMKYTTGGSVLYTACHVFRAVLCQAMDEVRNWRLGPIYCHAFRAVLYQAVDEVHTTTLHMLTVYPWEGFQIKSSETHLATPAEQPFDDTTKYSPHPDSCCDSCSDSCYVRRLHEWRVLNLTINYFDVVEEYTKKKYIFYNLK